MQALMVGRSMSTVQAVHADPDTVFLSLSTGDTVQVLYVGWQQEETDWTYGSRSDGAQRWLPCDALGLDHCSSSIQVSTFPVK